MTTQRIKKESVCTLKQQVHEEHCGSKLQVFSILNDTQSIVAEAQSRKEEPKCYALMQCCMQCQCVKGWRSVLTVMTDTPAVVLLSLGPVLKCFLIFPATDSWGSFSDTPSSWKIQRTKPQQLLPAVSRRILFFFFFFTSTCRYTGDSGERTEFKMLNLHWPKGDRAPAQLCISDPPPPAASQWSEPKERHFNHEDPVY